ncbi:MAG TPA: aminotransferase class IV [Candidatus Acidoferrum sp.]|nr:aminotransferase class IV [Candidatus Acidoferrum sp.]
MFASAEKACGRLGGTHMIHRYVFHNDKLAPIEEVRMSPGQGGLLGGWGLFTTVRVREGVPFAFERHWKRLERDAQKTKCPFLYEEEIVRKQLGEVLRANQVNEGCARIYVVFNQAGFWRSDESFPRTDLFLCSSDLPTYRETAKLGVREHGRHAASALAGTKVTSWINNLWSLQEAQQAGFDEVVLLNERGEVSECTAANIFCVRGGRVVTPPLVSGCLEGVTRSVLLEIGATAGAPVEERTLLPEDLYVAEEVFISSTNRDLLPVAEINENKIAAVNGPIVQKLEKAFAGYVREYIDARLAAAPRA